MKISELREMSSEQLEATLVESRDTLFRLRIKAQMERLDAPSEMRKHRRDIARIKTLQAERVRIAKQEGAGASPAEVAHA